MISNVTVILCDNQGREYPFGSTCIRKILNEEGLAKLKVTPNFTQAAPGEEREGRNNGGAMINESGNPRDREAACLRRVLTYLLLRQERLAHIPGATYDPLSAYANDYRQSCQLSENALKHILNIERKCADGKYSLGNLQTVYAYDCCLDRVLEATPTSKQGWLRDVQVSLRQELYLSQKQAQGVEN